MAYRAVLISIIVAFSQTPPYIARPSIWDYASLCVPVYSPAFSGTRCAYPLSSRLS